MTVGIAAICAHEGKYAIVMCCDFQGTRGDYLKAEDTDKMRDFDNATILYADEVDAAVEFCARFEEVVRVYNSLAKPEEDLDLRFGIYLKNLRELVRAVIRERQDHAISVKFGISLAEFHAVDAPKKFFTHRYDEISEEIKKIDLGAEFIIAYSGDVEPILLRIRRDGHVSLEETNFMAIGSGEAIAMAAFNPEYESLPQSLPECLLRVFQAKRWAEANPYVGKMTTVKVLLAGGRDFELSEEAWDLLGTIQRVSYNPAEDLKRWSELKSASAVGISE